MGEMSNLTAALFREIEQSKDNVIKCQADVIETLRQMVKVQGELIELLRKAGA